MIVFVGIRSLNFESGLKYVQIAGIDYFVLNIVGVHFILLLLNSRCRIIGAEFQ